MSPTLSSSSSGWSPSCLFRTKKEVLRAHLRPRSLSSVSSYDPLINAIGKLRLPPKGTPKSSIDGSHGTYQFFAHHTNLTKCLIREIKGFTAVTIEADWLDAWKANVVNRFPKWMWTNEVMPPFIDWMKHHNQSVFEAVNDPSQTVSFYGMDLYSLHRSAEQVVQYLETVDQEGAKYNCFERFGEDTMREVINNLKMLLLNRQTSLAKRCHATRTGIHPQKEQFVAEMNALVVEDAEEYYRTMMTEDVRSWNLRISQGQSPALHGSYIGSAKPGSAGAKIVVMERRRDQRGTTARELFRHENVPRVITAAHNSDEPPFLQWMNPPIDGSIEAVFDKWASDDCFVVTYNIVTDQKGFTRKVEFFLNRPRYQRFMGVIYSRLTEIPSYSKCSVAQQYDATGSHKSENQKTFALKALGRVLGSAENLVDETFPFGL
ncbi:hypothetical protein LXA43DRAFT_1070574 [Ganoderma leucocontextum]|nr:hypothetical protein LXA43DRAFT_1070574 [Ganoderma leucocontextum]